MNWLWLTPFAFIVPYVITMKLLAFFSGWEQLAKRFRCPGHFEGKIYHLKSARIKWTSYKGCMKVGVNDDGLYLAVIWSFSLFHNPLLIPWEEFHAEFYENFFVSGYTLNIKSLNGFTIFLYGDVFQRCVRRVGSGDESN